MNSAHEFFEGLIAQDLQEILNAAAGPDSLLREAAGAKKPASGKPACKPAEKPKTGQLCRDKDRDKKDDTEGPTCSTDGKSCRPKKKTDAFLPGVEGWSSPPALPPA